MRAGDAHTSRRRSAARRSRPTPAAAPRGAVAQACGPKVLAHGGPKVLAYGGGLDSFTDLLLAIERDELPDAVVFADVGDPNGLDPAEWPGTYRHLREVVQPLCARHAIPFVWLDTTSYPVRGERSLFAWLEARNQIPVAGPRRICTIIAKVERFERWLDDTYPDQDVEVWVGFEKGEESRAEKDPNAGTKRAPKPGHARRYNRFPVMEAGFCRCRCETFVRALGYAVPRKSACVFCPYASRGDWQTYARELPRSFARVVRLELSKPPTKVNKLKLSIMGFGKRKNGTYRASPLPVFIQGTYTPRKQSCKVCGASQRASKATGCDFLPAPKNEPLSWAALAAQLSPITSTLGVSP